MNITTLWDKCLKDISDRLSEKQMKTWLHPLEVKLEQNILSIVAPNKFIKDAVETDYLKIIKETVYNQSEETVNTINLSLQEAGIKKEAYVQERGTKDINSNLNKELVFTSFVEGKSNQLAKAACVSVVSKLGQYNPLYIYGGVGLGKTHLLHSIGNEILANDINKRVVYLHSEKFVQNMVTALRQNKIEEFKTFYRSVDALLLDDIQFFANKERSQEEFFHTFNTLFEYKKQVVLTSDKYPKEITGLEERIKSRLVWGMNVTIDPPDLETRMAILHSKAEQSGEKIPEDVAYFLAKNDSTYTNPNLDLIDQYAEAWSYYLIKASADLAIEQGACPGTNETKYGDGITPNQTYKKDVDELVKHVERMDWKGLRKQLADTGIRNSTLMALMPSETSAQISNATNGVEPPRAFVSVKQSKDGVLKQVVPGYPRLKNKYELLWDQQSPEGYIKIMAVLQKYIDQGISVNTSYNPTFYEEEKIPMSTMLQHLLMAYKYGTKQLYYFNTYDGSGDDMADRVEGVMLELPDEVQIDEEHCDSCAI